MDKCVQEALVCIVDCGGDSQCLRYCFDQETECSIGMSIYKEDPVRPVKSEDHFGPHRPDLDLFLNILQADMDRNG